MDLSPTEQKRFPIQVLWQIQMGTCQFCRIAVGRALRYRGKLSWLDTMHLRCEGCGQVAPPEHVARRLRRLEWATRYRPVHISNLFLGAFSPQEDSDFLYAPKGEFSREAALLLDAVGIHTAGKSRDAVLAEFQKAGYFWTHVLECPLESEAENNGGLAALLAGRLGAVASRIRRSLKPRRVMVITEDLEPITQNLAALDLGSPVVLNNGKPFAFNARPSESELSQFREKLAGTPAAEP